MSSNKEGQTKALILHDVTISYGVLKNVKEVSAALLDRPNSKSMLHQVSIH